LIAAIVLTAGKSERMGFPKALLRFEGKTFLERILDAVERSDIGHVVVVVGHHQQEITQALHLQSVVFNPDYERGMSTSVQAGIRALPPGCSAAGVFLVDHPLIDPDTINRLGRHVAPGRIVVPVHEGRRGHPVFIASDIFHEILELGDDKGLNSVVRRDATRVLEVLVENSGVLRDIDTPEQFEKLLGESGE
jgi:CTP:molybdopterin cytidylyltransferase MocA